MTSFEQSWSDPARSRSLVSLGRKGPGGRRASRSFTAAGAVALGLAMTTGVAYAVWTTTGSGTGAAASGSTLPLTLAGGTVAGNLLYPGATGDVVVVISNPNPFPVSVTALTLPTTAATSFTNAGLTTSNAACDAGGTGVTWAYTTKALSGVVVAKKTGAVDGSLTLTLTGGASMSNASDSTCQSSFFKMPNVLTAVGASSTAAPVATISQ